MFKKLALTAFCALAVGSAAAGPIKPGETADNPLILNVNTTIPAGWNPDGAPVWTFAEWIHINDLTLLYVKTNANTTFDFGIMPPNSGNVQDFDFELLIDLAPATKTKPTGYSAYWDNVALTGGQVYTFKLNSLNVHDNNTNIDFKVMAGTANVPTDPGGGGGSTSPNEIPEPASLGLLALGLLSLGALRRRKE